MKWSKTRWNTCTILFLHAFLNNSLLCGVGQPKVWRTKEDQSNVWRQKSFFFLFLSRLLEISLRFKFFIQEENVPCQRGKAQLVKLLLTSQLSAKKYFKTSNQKLKLFFIFLFSNVCKNVVSIVNSVETTFFVWLIWLRSAKNGRDENISNDGRRPRKTQWRRRRPLSVNIYITKNMYFWFLNNDFF